MALVNVVNMAVLDNPTNFKSPFQFEITFECLQELDDDLEWKIIYVGKAEDSKSDIVLDEILVGPVPVGVNKFVLQAEAPTLGDSLSQDDVLGVTVVLVTCSFREREFVRVGYYVNNEYSANDYNPENGPPPKPLDLTLVTRQILADKPRVTRFPIPWGDNSTTGDAVQGDATTNMEASGGNGENANELEENGGASPASSHEPSAAAVGGGKETLAATVSSE